MEPKMIAEQILNFQKSLMLNARATTEALQEYGEKMIKVFTDSSSSQVPEETRAVVDTWMETLKKGQKDLEDLQDKGIETMRNYIRNNNL